MSGSTWKLNVGPNAANAGTLDDEIYSDIVEAFQEQLEIQGVPITFASIEKTCLAQRLDEKLEWQSAGFLPTTTVRVTLLDSDYADFVLAGINEAQATVDFEGLTFQVTEIKSVSSNPIVSILLNKSK
jgi:hypothetical protein